MELRIPLTPSQQSALKKWTAEFRAREPHWESLPRVEAGELRLPAPALPFLLAYGDPAEMTELDLRRLKKEGRRRLLALVSDRVHVPTVLRNLHEFAVGAFLPA